MKARAFIIGLSLGLMILSIVLLANRPPFGRANLGPIGWTGRDASPILMLAACLAIAVSAVKLRYLSIIGILLMIGSLAVGYFVAERTGYSMGTPGWSTIFFSTFVIIPAGLLLCVLTGIFSLAQISEAGHSVRNQVLVSLGIVLLVGIAYQVVISIKPDLHVLVAALKNEDLKSQRFKIAGQLMEIDDPEKVDLLMELFKHQDPQVRQVAVLALGTRPRKDLVRALEPLLQALDKETFWAAKGDMIQQLALLAPMCEQVDKDRIVDVLIEILKTDKSYARGKAADSLGLIKDKRAIEPLLQALDEEPRHALEALISITGERDEQVWKKWIKEKKL